MTAGSPTSGDGTGRAAELSRLALRRGVRATPFGAAAGALLGLIGGGTDNGLTANETALMMAALLGFGLVPAAVAAISVARRVRFGSSGTLERWGTGIGGAALTGLGWGAIGAVVSFGAGSLVDLNVNLGGLMTTAIGAGAVAGVVSGLLVLLASLTARGRDASGAPSGQPQ